jgi:MFS family permease
MEEAIMLGEDVLVSDSPRTVPSSTSQIRKITLVFQLSAINFLASTVNGLITVGLPKIASDLNLPQELYFWPASVYGLATGSTLLLAGSAADIIGAPVIDLVGCFGLGIFLLGGGLAQTGTELVVFRAIQGVALSLHLSSSVGIVSDSFARGRSRNIAFSFLGLSQPLGFSVGLVAGGILVDTVGWRSGWYVGGGVTLLLSLLGLWTLPRPRSRISKPRDLLELKDQVDWVGAAIASTFMASLSYLLA